MTIYRNDQIDHKLAMNEPVSTSYIWLTDFVEIGGTKIFLKLIYNKYDAFLKYNWLNWLIDVIYGWPLTRPVTYKFPIIASSSTKRANSWPTKTIGSFPRFLCPRPTTTTACTSSMGDPTEPASASTTSGSAPTRGAVQGRSPMFYFSWLSQGGANLEKNTTPNSKSGFFRNVFKTCRTSIWN